MWAISLNEMWGLAVVLAISLIPVGGASILSFRSFRRRWWLAGPGLLFAVLTPLLGWGFHAGKAFGEDGTLGLALSSGMFIASWAATGLFLTVLAVAGPKLPVIDVGEVF